MATRESPESNAPEPNRVRFPLGLKLAGALAAAALVMLAFLVLRFGPNVKSAFLKKSRAIIALSRQAMDQMAGERTAESREVLIRLIEHTTESRRRQLADLPLSLYGGDVQRLREVIADTDRAKGERLGGNVEILADEMQRRFRRDAERRLDEIERRQEAMGESFAASVRRSYLILTGTVLLSLVVLLGFGLYHGVINPVRRLRRVTQAITRGDLQVGVAQGPADEVGDLADDFGAMLAQLRQSREDVRRKALELKELNRSLEVEVERKTRHLAQALEEVRTAQGRLVHAAKMASIGTLAGGVAHEFNNLIGGIRGCAAEAIESIDDPRSREPLEVILRASERAADITRQLLRFSRRQELQRTTIRFDELLGDCLRLFEPQARRRDVRIVCRVPAGVTLAADSGALHQVVLNLLTNALQAMPDGGRIELQVEADDTEVCLRVTDTGVGIPDGAREHVFEPFFTTRGPEAGDIQAADDGEGDPGRRRTRGGTGLGLAVSYGLVEAHGGTIEFETEVGRGSCFIVRLPRCGPETTNE